MTRFVNAVIACMLGIALTHADDAQLFSVEVTADVEYGVGVVRDADGEESVAPLKLDVYLPKDSPEKAKAALLIVHGGGFRGGDKAGESFVAFARYFAERGFACFSINYRMMKENPPAPEEFYKGNLQMAAAHAAFVDAKTAVRWIRANAEQYGIDPNRIAAMGGSAGAITSLAVAFTDDSLFLTDLPGQEVRKENHAGVSSRVQACVSCWGTASAFADAIDKNDPPVLLIHGAEDKNVNTPPSASEFIHKRCQELGIPSELHLIPGMGHGAWKGQIDGKALPEVAWSFVTKHFERQSETAGDK